MGKHQGARHYGEAMKERVTKAWYILWKYTIFMHHDASTCSSTMRQLNDNERLYGLPNLFPYNVLYKIIS